MKTDCKIGHYNSFYNEKFNGCVDIFQKFVFLNKFTMYLSFIFDKFNYYTY